MSYENETRADIKSMTLDELTEDFNYHRLTQENLGLTINM